MKNFIILIFILSFYLLTSGKNYQVSANISGAEIYKKHCLVCHQADGSGVPGMFPPLVRTNRVLGPPDSLIRVIISGISGPLTVNGNDYEQVMPAMNYLTDSEIASVLTFIRSSWGNKAAAVPVKDVKRVRFQTRTSH